MNTTAVSLKGKRVLVLEDETLVSMMVEDMLSDLECEVVGPFARLDQAIAGVRSAANGQVTQAVSRGLAQVDSGLAKLSAARSQAGELLNRADTIGDRLTTRSDQLEKVRADAEDADPVKVLSDISSQQTMYSAALGTYAQIQKLSLFNYLS